MADLHLCEFTLIAGAMVMACISLNTSGWITQAIRYGAICALLAAGLLAVLP